MSPHFYKCIQYEHLDTLSDSQKDSLANFLHPEVIPNVLNAMVGRLHYNNANPTSPLKHNNSTLGKSYITTISY